MTDRTNPHRRTVLKTLGASVIGATTLAGTASADDTGDNRRQDSFTWADDTLYEMLDTEQEDPTTDSEGADEAHAPIYVVGPQDPDGHSPHFHGADHVISVQPGTYSPQWHLKLLAEFTVDGPIPASEGVNGEPLTNVDAVHTLADEDGYAIVDRDFVFTCPVRPHRHK